MKLSSAFFLAVALGAVVGAACGSAKPPCTATTCPGCCDSFGSCQQGTAQNACGLGGNACQPCFANQVCSLGNCIGGTTGGGGPTGGGSGGGTGGGATGGGSGGGATGGGGGSVGDGGFDFDAGLPDLCSIFGTPCTAGQCCDTIICVNNGDLCSFSGTGVCNGATGQCR